MTGENRESALLRGLSHKGTPKFEMEYDDGQTLYVLREYVEGLPLDQFMDESGMVSPALSIGIAAELCDVLTYLHTQTPPIIHRDIKPSNIIVTAKGNGVKLIDFGISRRYSENAENDTEHFGTQKFAAPEQYGFKQTDSRSDIFSLGVVLRYMLTGTTDEKVSDTELERIISKCSAFSPDDRYRSAESVKQALKRYERRVKMKIALAAASFIALCLVFAIGFMVGGNMEKRRAESYAFAEPLIEQAVRAQLGIGEREITKSDLLRVEVLAVVGTEVFTMTGDLSDYDNNLYTSKFLSPNNGLEHGNIRVLDDIAMMTNLKHLALVGQQITDITKLKGLPLERLILEGNPITDISVLRYCPDLIEVALGNTRLHDASVGRYLMDVQLFGVGFTGFASFEQLSGANFYFLHAVDVPAKDYEALQTFPRLVDLAVSPQSTAELESIVAAASLTRLEIVNGRVTDYEPLKRMKSLNELLIYGSFSYTADYSALAEVEWLRKVYASAEILERIKAAIPDPDFELVIKE
jgi:hypothetical protein